MLIMALLTTVRKTRDVLGGGKVKHVSLAALFCLTAITCACAKGGQYSGEVTKIHPNMSKADVVATLGEPYGSSGSFMIYHKNGADTLLAIMPDEHGDCQWLILEVPPSGLSEQFTYYKVRESSAGGPAAIGMPIFRAR